MYAELACAVLAILIGLALGKLLMLKPPAPRLLAPSDPETFCTHCGRDTHIGMCLPGCQPCERGDCFVINTHPTLQPCKQFAGHCTHSVCKWTTKEKEDPQHATCPCGKPLGQCVISFNITGSGEGKFVCLSTENPEQAEAAIKSVGYGHRNPTLVPLLKKEELEPSDHEFERQLWEKRMKSCGTGTPFTGNVDWLVDLEKTLDKAQKAALTKWATNITTEDNRDATLYELQSLIGSFPSANRDWVGLHNRTVAAQAALGLLVEARVQELDHRAKVWDCYANILERLLEVWPNPKAIHLKEVAAAMVAIFDHIDHIRLGMDGRVEDWPESALEEEQTKVTSLLRTASDICIARGFEVLSIHGFRGVAKKPE